MGAAHDVGTATLALQQHIHTAASADGRRLLTAQVEGSNVYVLDHRLDRIQALSLTSASDGAPTHAAAAGSSMSKGRDQDDAACVRVIHAHIDDEERFLVAASNGSDTIHFWQEPRSTSLFLVKGRNWRLHSSLTLPSDDEDEENSVTMFDLAIRKLPVVRNDPFKLNNSRHRDESPRTQLIALVGSTASISLWSLSDLGAPAWRREWIRRTPASVVCASLTQDGTLAAAFIAHDVRAMIWSITAPHQGGSSGFRTPSRNSGSASVAVAESANSPELGQNGVEDRDKARERPFVRLIDRIEHSRLLVALEWRKAADGPSARSDPVLVTHTTDGIARIWATVIDQPLQFRLWSSIYAASLASSGLGLRRACKTRGRVFYLGAQETTMAFKAHIWELEKEQMRAELGVEDFDLPDVGGPSSSRPSTEKSQPLDQEKKRKRDRERDVRRTRLQRLQQIVSDTPDVFLAILDDGTLEISAVANVDRSPPTLFQTMTLSQTLRLPRSVAPSITSARLVPMLTPSSIATLSTRDDGASRATASLVLTTNQGRQLQYGLTAGLLFDGEPAGLRLGSVSAARSRRRMEAERDEADSVLPLCHPRMLQLALTWGTLDLVDAAVLQLDDSIKATDPEDVVELAQFPSTAERFSTARRGHQSSEDASRTEDLTRARDDILEAAPQRRISGLDGGDIAQLSQAVDVAKRVREKANGLDIFGRRFATSLVQAAVRAEAAAGDKKRPPKRLCLSGSEAAWAAHSSHQAKLIQLIEETHGGRLTWPAASGSSLFLWLKGPAETVRQHAESLARAQYTGGPADGDDDQHDPTRCSMLYYALGKHKLVLSLWRQAAWHPDQQKMIAFLSNDFTEERWRTAALKNAFALMSKRKFELAGAFFLLGGSLRDATNVCARNLEDIELAVAVARIAEGREDGPVLRGIVQGKLLPLALERGDRGLASLAFGLLGERKLERRVLIVPSLVDFVGQDEGVRRVLGEALSRVRPATTGDASDDLSALLLYNHLQMQPDHPRTDEMDAEARDAVLRHARELRRAGCDIFALRLVLDWSFPLPTNRRPSSTITEAAIASPTTTSEEDELDPVAAAKAKLKLRPPPAVAASDELSSSLWDNFGGAAVTGPPTTAFTAMQAGKETKDSTSTSTSTAQPAGSKKTGLGTLMKPVSTAQHQQGGADFDMSAFGF